MAILAGWVLTKENSPGPLIFERILMARYSKPKKVPRWADNPPPGSGAIVEPGEAKKDKGWELGEKTAFSYFNWLNNLTGNWLKWFDERFSDGSTKDELKIIDPGSGIRIDLTSGNRFAVWHGDKDLLKVQDNGYVGIGINPRDKLHVPGAVRFGGSKEGGGEIDGDFLRIEAAQESTDRITIRFDQAALRFWNPNAPTNAGEIMRITKLGNVGIGTTGPSGKLTVVGSEGDGRSVTIDDKEIKFRGDGIAHFSIFANREGGKLTIEDTSGDAAPGRSGKVLLAIANDGNVGIGTTEPKNKLHIAGNAGVLNLEGTDHAYIQWYPNKYTAGRKAWTGFGDSDTKQLTIKNEIESGDILLLTNNGNVGIGTTEPKNKLHIAGNAGVLNLEGTDHAYIQWYPNKYAAGRKAWTGFGDADTKQLTIKNEIESGDILLLTNNGNVGIGTTDSLSQKLTVNGNIKLLGNRIYGTGIQPGDFLWLMVNSETEPSAGPVMGLYSDGNDPNNNRVTINGRVDMNDRVTINGNLNEIMLEVNGKIASHGNRTILYKVDGSGHHWFQVGGIGEGANALGFNMNARQIRKAPGWIINFMIDHPLYPKDKYLIHSVLEGPETAVYYRGEGRLSNGEATVHLPKYFEALTRKEDRTVLLTPKFEPDSPVSELAASEVKDGRFIVKMIDGKNPLQTFYWEVKAVRADIERLEVEESKTLSE
jgi:hypothetical protein